MKTLREKIEKAIEKEAMKKGIMGTENCTVTLTLTDAEKEELFSLDFALNHGNYWWEIDGNKLTVIYTEEPTFHEIEKTYKAEYEDENIEVFKSISNDEALKEAWRYEKNHGTLFNLFVIDDDYNEVETIL